MREIKFRAWDTAYNFMRYPGYSDEYISLLDGKSYEVNEHGECELPYKLMQFTGLHDKNGKEIYENDILKIDGMKCVVKYSNLSASYIAECIDEDAYWDLGVYTQKLGIELIGNVFEDGELIASNN